MKNVYLKKETHYRLKLYTLNQGHRTMSDSIEKLLEEKENES